MLVRRIAFAALLSSAALAAGTAFTEVASAATVTIPTAVADALKGQGQGLCVATAVSMTPSLDFPQMAGVFNAGMNAFIEAHKADRKEYVQRTIFDLSNNYKVGVDTRSYGDFLDAMLPTCKTGGCDFFINDSTTSFGARFRGFLNVTSDMAGTELHLGVYADDAVSLVIYDKNGNGYTILTQPPVLGIPTWRVTQAVQFDAPGLYPIEILYAEIADHAALEMSYFKGPFTDFQRSINDPAGKNLKTSGFTLFKETSFFQTLSGSPSYPDLDTCKQCDRQFVGQIGNNGCDSGYYCNEAALCAPCDTAVYCGPTCSPCGGMTPFCINTNGKLECANCRTDLDCKEGFSCDPATHVCNECNVDTDCPRGKICQDHACTVCSTPDQCAGNSCNCCPKGPTSGVQMACREIEDGHGPECVECTKDMDCPKGVCDVLTGQCVPELAKNEKPKCCGDDCLTCPSDNPLCLPGPFGTACAACRSDLDCGADNFCLAGQCTECTRDRRCGERCTTCTGDTPYCLDAQLAKDAKCVRCNKDDECNGGKCDPKTHACTSSCDMSCAPETPYCDGQSCVECYADTQCPCNGTCDPSSHKCSPSCKSNADCNGDQHCHHTDDGLAKECSPGPLPDNVDCGSTLADACASSIGSRGTDPTPAAGILGLGALAALLRRRGQQRGGRR
jgi:outer membrane exchange protein TraA